MQIRNNYDLEWHKDGEPGAGIFNGDIGKILTLQKKTGEAVVCFDGRTAVYSFDQLEQLELAYAITVHKSQGSQYDAILMPVSTATAKMLYRNLLYTAISRARKEVILVGSREAVNTAMQCIPYPRKSKLVARTNLLRLRRSAWGGDTAGRRLGKSSIDVNNFDKKKVIHIDVKNFT